MASAANNTIQIVDKLAKRALPMLREQMLFANHVNFDNSLVSQMTSVDGGGKGGGTIRVRKPVRYTVRSGTSRNVQSIVEHYVNVPAPSMKGVDFTIASSELTKDIEWIAARYLMPAVAQLATQVDQDIAANYYKLPNVVGLPGTNPNQYAYLTHIQQRMSELNVPNDGNRIGGLTPAHYAGLQDTMKGLFSQSLTEDAVRRGELGTLARIKWAETNSVPTHTTGTFSAGSTPMTVGNHAQGVQTISTDGWANSTNVLKAGDVFTISGIYEVNPMTRQSTGVLKQFVAHADVTSDNSGLATIRVVPSDESGGLYYNGSAYQNMSAQITNDTAINVWGANGASGDSSLSGAASQATAYSQSLAFHRDCFWLGMFPLTSDLPGAEVSTQTDSKSGVSVRVTRQYDVTEDDIAYRMDIYYSTDVMMPDLGVRLIGA